MFFHSDFGADALGTVAVGEGADDVHARVGFRQAGEERGQAFAAFVRLRVVLDVLRLVDDGGGSRVARFDALEELAD